MKTEEKEHVKNVLELLRCICDNDMKMQDDIRIRLDMTYEEYLKHNIEQYYAKLRNTPEHILKTKFSDLIKDYLA